MKTARAARAAAVLVAVSGFVSLLGAFAALVFEPVFVADFLVLALGPVLFFVALELWRLKPRAWTASLVVVVLDMLVFMYTLFSVPRDAGRLITLTAWINLSLALAIVYLLSRRDVQALFSHPARP